MYNFGKNFKNWWQQMIYFRNTHKKNNDLWQLSNSIKYYKKLFLQKYFYINFTETFSS